MANYFNRQRTTNFLTAVFFLLYFLYFSLLNGYHLMYFEQDQLFRYNWNFLSEFFQKPGGLVALLNGFIVQFFINPWLAGAIVTFVAIVIYLLSRRVLLGYGFIGIVFPFILLIFLCMSLSNQNSSFLMFSGLILTLLVFWGYVYIRKNKLRNIIILISVFPLYFLLGIFSLQLVLMIVISEVFFSQGKLRFIISGFSLVVTFFSVFLSWSVLFYIHPADAFLSPINPGHQKEILLIYLSVLSILPSFMLLAALKKRLKIEFRWNFGFIASGILLIAASIFVLVRFGYDSRNNKLQEIDFHVQKENWEEVLKLSRKYPGRNQLVLYYSNLALYQTGRMGDQMFYYPQSGTKGLWLEWQRNEMVSYYGGEVFYRLGFSNEAFRWAFEAMEAKGMNPRSLKRLVITSLINWQNDIARKYLRFLTQTLFYSKWAKEYITKVDDPNLLKNDSEIVSKRDLAPHKDFISYMTQYDIGLFPLLENHPHNKMAFEYMMAAFLLNKNLHGFAANIYRLKELGYSRIPVHFEEAMIIYTGVTKKEIVPEGFTISASTRERFHSYAQILNMYGDDQNMAAKALFKDYGNTFWYYMQYNN